MWWGSYCLERHDTWPLLEHNSDLTRREAELEAELEEVDADPVPQLRQSIMSDTSGVGNSRILAKSVPIVNSMVGGAG